MSTSRLADRSRATATRPRQRRWFLEVRERKVYLVREGEELSSFSGMKMGAIMDVSIGKEHSKGRQEADNALMVSS